MGEDKENLQGHFLPGRTSAQSIVNQFKQYLLSRRCLLCESFVSDMSVSIPTKLLANSTYRVKNNEQYK